MSMRWNIINIISQPRIQEIARLDHEVSLVLYVGPEKILGKKQYDKIGNAEGVELPDIGEVVRGCHITGTKHVILIHNHPYIGGECDPTPSQGDLDATRIFKNQLKLFGIKLLDHIILAPSGYFSFKASKLLQ